MKEISPRLFIGNDCDCVNVGPDWAVVHACKTCHQKRVGYRGSLPASHPNYLIYEEGFHLYLNLVDMEREFLPKFTHPIMQVAFRFLGSHHKKHNVLVHCNQGYSRSPAIGLLWLARQNSIRNYATWHQQSAI